MSDSFDQVIWHRHGWDEAVQKVRQCLSEHHEKARNDADDFVAKYVSRRGPMVVDVVTSRQRKYESKVTKLVNTYVASAAALDLRTLVDKGSGLDGLRDDEEDTIRNVARGLLKFGIDFQITDDDELVTHWSNLTFGLEVANNLDPYAGSVKGIGPALFAYLRMRSGGDSLKPDSRVRKKLAEFGFEPPATDEALWVLARVIAAELNVPMLVLDKLLW